MRPNQPGAEALETWIDLLTERAALAAARPACTFLLDGEENAQTLSYTELHARVRALAARLQDAARPADRVLVLVPPGPDFIVAFLACLYAGLIAVPVPPPTRARGLPRLLSIARDCMPSVILTNDELSQALAALAGTSELAPLRALRVVSTDGASDAAAYRRPDVNGQTVAFLQYTSGSTGTPKGVVLTHENLLHNERSIQQAFQHDADSVVVGWLPPFHDMGLIGNLLQPLFVGGHGIQMTPAHFLMKPARWLAAISRFRATTSGGPNFAFDLCVQKIASDERSRFDLSSWRLAFNGAEPVRASSLERFSRAFAVAGFRENAFYPCYGLAEATLLVSGGKVERPPVVRPVDRTALDAGRIALALQAERSKKHVTQLVSSGVAWGSEVRIVDPDSGAPCAAGKVGEIWVRGTSVAQGYWQRVNESGATFGASTSAGEGGFLRTGDLGALLNDELFVTGRLKDLIIVRGRNLYPQDLELAAQESVHGLSTGGGAAFSVARDDADEAVVLVHEVASSRFDHAGAARAIEQAIADRFEVALHAIVLIKRGSLPRTTSGKVRRSTCRQRWLDGSLETVWSSLTQAGAVTSAAPAQVESGRTPLEQQLAAVWAQELGRAVGRNDGFLQLGGDSLRALQINGQLREALGIELSPVQLFETTTVASLAAWIEDKRGESAAAVAGPRVAVDRVAAEEFGLSRVQERLWFLEQLQPGKSTYHISGALRLQGTLDVGVLQRAVSLLTKRHPALRTTFHARSGKPIQRVAPEAVPSLTLTQATGSTELAVALGALRAPFDLSQSAARWLLVALDQREHWLGFCCHHLIADGWSATILVRELMALYGALARGENGDLPELACSYADYVAHETAPEQLAAQEGALAYWRDRFTPPVAPLELPSDRPRPAWPSHAGARREFELPTELVVGLARLGRGQGATPFATFVAAFALLLSRCCGQDELCLGTPVSQRPAGEHRNLVGCCLNTLALRIDVSGNPQVDELVARARDVVNGALKHQAAPFESVLRAARPDRESAQGQLFRAMISLQPALPELRTGSDLSAVVVQLDGGAAQHELSLDLIPSVDGTRVRAAWEYSTELFDALTIEHLTEQLLALWSDMAQKPEQRVSELRLGTESAWRGGFAAAVASENVPALPVHQQFEIEAQVRPDQEALVCDRERWSYAQLNQAANRLARHLRGKGARPEQRIAIYLERTPALLVSTLAVLKAGAAYVSIDAATPAERVAYMLADARVATLITTRLLAETLPEPRPSLVLVDEDAAAVKAQPDGDPSYAGSLHQLAYVLYTSGTTGTPKGVMVSHEGLAQTLSGWRETYLHRDLSGAGLRLLSLASSAFDVWTADWVRALCAGGTLLLAPRELALDARALNRELLDERVTLLDVVPALAKHLAQVWTKDAAPASTLRLLIVGSDSWSADDLALLRSACAPTTRILSCYGVTEATIDSAVFDPAVTKLLGGSVPLGSATPHTRLYVLDRAGQPLPIGIPGELAIGGGGVARGYLERPTLTAERFMPDPFGTDGGRLYKTGDRVRVRVDGTLEFLGRLDDQIKLRGVRIELGEIEARLRLHPEVSDVAVVLQESVPGHPMLAAFVVASSPGEVDPAGLSAFLRPQLPAVMIPSAFVSVPHLPLTANGKVDRRSLAARRSTERAVAAKHVAPQSQLEEAIAASFGRVLSLQQVSVDKNFFDLGGHSLLLAELASDLGTRIGREVPLLTLLQHPSVSTLAAALRGDAADDTKVEPRDDAAQQRRTALLARRRAVQESDG